MGASQFSTNNSTSQLGRTQYEKLLIYGSEDQAAAHDDGDDENSSVEKLIEEYEQLPEKRILKTILPRVLIQRGDWSEALNFMKEKTTQ